MLKTRPIPKATGIERDGFFITIKVLDRFEFRFPGKSKGIHDPTQPSGRYNTSFPRMHHKSDEVKKKER